VDSTLLRPFAGASHGEELAVLEMVTTGAPNGATAVSWVDYRDYRDNLKLISGLAAHRQAAFTLGEGTGAQLVWGELASGNFFDLLGVRARLGRTFDPEENGDKPGAYPVTVISDRLWRSKFRSDPGLIGQDHSSESSSPDGHRCRAS
jgi:hypothetical protein